jgi:AcrR family transcriptional regulator
MAHANPTRQQRLLGAMIELVAWEGYHKASVEVLCELAQLSPEAFFVCFPDLESCFLAAFDDIVLRGCVVLVEATRDVEDWAEQISCGLSALLGFLDEEPSSSRFLVVESFGVSMRVLWRRSRLLDRFVEVVHDGGCEAGDGPAPARHVAREAVVTAHSVVYESLTARECRALAPLAAPLTSVIVLPYLGEGVACAELGLIGGWPAGRASREWEL